MEFGQYDANQKLNYADYAAHVWSFAQELDRAYKKSELVTTIAEHYEWDIRYAVRSQGIRTQSAFFDLLEFKDREKGKISEIRPRNTANNPRSNNDDTTSRTPAREQETQSNQTNQNQTSNQTNSKPQFPPRQNTWRGQQGRNQGAKGKPPSKSLMMNV